MASARPTENRKQKTGDSDTQVSNRALPTGDSNDTSTGPVLTTHLLAAIDFPLGAGLIFLEAGPFFEVGARFTVLLVAEKKANKSRMKTRDSEMLSLKGVLLPCEDAVFYLGGFKFYDTVKTQFQYIV